MTVKRLKSLSRTQPIAHELSDSGKWTYEAKLDGLLAHGHRMIYLVESSVHVLSLLMSTEDNFEYRCSLWRSHGAMR